MNILTVSLKTKFLPPLISETHFSLSCSKALQASTTSNLTQSPGHNFYQDKSVDENFHRSVDSKQVNFTVPDKKNIYCYSVTLSLDTFHAFVPPPFTLVTLLEWHAFDQGILYDNKKYIHCIIYSDRANKVHLKSEYVSHRIRVLPEEFIVIPVSIFTLIFIYFKQNT